MAATGYTPISLYYSTTASAVPIAGNLANGELALNIADMKLYAKNSAGTVTLLASNASTTGVDSLSFGSTGLTPSTATTGAITVAGTLNVANGGTGSTSLTAGRVLFGAGTSAVGNSANLFWDNGNSRLGIGTATPRGPIDAIGRSYFQASGSNNVLTLVNTSGGDGSIQVTGTSTTLNYSFNTYSVSNALYIQNDGSVGIGTSSPAQLLDVQSATSPTIRISNSKEWASGDSGVIAAYQFYTKDASTPNGTKIAAYINSENYAGSSVPEGILTFGTSAGGGSSTNATEKMRLDSAGNLGLGVTPSAWARTAMQIGGAGSVSYFAATNIGVMSSNMYFDGGSNRYIGSNYAYQYAQSGGQHIWQTAASGTAGSVATFSTLMTLDASGNLGVGTTSPSARLDVKGAGGGSGKTFRTTDSSGNETFAIQDGGFAYFNYGGLSVGTTTSPGAGAIYATGNITAYYSDDRLKTRLGNIENALDKVDQLQGFYYEANETAQALGYKVKREVGVSAQSVQAVLPEIVSPAPIDQQYLTVDYERLVPLLIEAVKELRAEVKALKGE